MLSRSGLFQGQRTPNTTARSLLEINGSLQRPGSMSPHTNPRSCEEGQSTALYPPPTPHWDEPSHFHAALDDKESPSSVAWRQCVESLTAGEKALFLDKEFDGIDNLVAALQGAAHTQSERSRTLNIANKLKPVTDAVNLYSGFAQTLAENGPGPSALVLGGINCILALPERYSSYQKRLSEVLCEMGKKLSTLTIHYERLYSQHEDVRQALVHVFADIVEFCRDAAKLLYDEKGGIKKAVSLLGRSLISSFESKLGDKVRKFETDLAHFEDCVKAAVRDDAALFQTSAEERLVSIERGQRVIGSAQSIIASQILYQSHVASVNEQVHQALLIKAKTGKFFTHVTPDVCSFRVTNTKSAKAKTRKGILERMQASAIDFENDHRNKSRQRLEGTGDWLLNDPVFAQSVTRIRSNPDNSESGCNLLSIQGKSGSGKSFLASRVIDKYCKRSGGRTLGTAGSFVYCSSMDVAKTDPSRLLFSILHQLFQSMSDEVMDSAVGNLFEKQEDVSKVSDEQLEDAIISVAGKFKDVYVVVDGLDECYSAGEDRLSLLSRSLRRIAEGSPKTLSLLCFSRPGYTDIDRAFDGCDIVRVEEANNNDIGRYISSVITDGEFRIRDNQSLLDLVGERLTQGAEGSFLWIKLLAKNLKPARTKNQVLSRLDSLPKGMDDVYERALERVLGVEDEDEKELNLKILLWVANARRPLSRHELREALAISPGSRDLDYANCIETDEGITTDCGDLIILQNDHFTLCHSSLRDYLTNLGSPHSVKDMRYREMQTNANRILGQTCMTYLMFEKFRQHGLEKDYRRFSAENPFLWYAARFWADHVRDELEDELYPQIRELVTCQPARSLILQHYDFERGNQNRRLLYFPSEPLHLLSLVDLLHTAKRLTDDDNQEFTHDTDGAGYLPLAYAFIAGSERMASWILSQDSPQQPVRSYPHLASITRTAAERDWHSILATLFSLGYDDGSATIGDGRTALHISASRGSKRAVDMLLSSGVDVNAVCRNYQTPLIAAIHGNHPTVIDTLIHAGADIKLQSPLHEAARMGNRDLVERLLDSGVEDCIVRGGAALHVAAMANQVEIVATLANHGSDIRSRGANQLTPLFMAIECGALNAAKALVQLGSDLLVVNEAGKNMFHRAVEAGQGEAVEYLMEICPDLITALTTAGETALHLAFRDPNGLCWERAKLLLEKGVNPHARAPDGETILHLAVKYKCGDGVIRDLLSQYQLDPSIGGADGGTALHYAMYFGAGHLVKLLIEAGADPHAVDNNGTTVLGSWRDDPACFWELTKAVPEVDLHAKNQAGESVLHHAAEVGADEIVRWLLEHGANPCQETKNQDLPIHYSSDFGFTKCTELFLNAAKASINTVGFKKRTPLLMAIMSNRQEVIQLLLQHNADVAHRDTDGWCALGLAVRYGYDDTAELLLSHGADPFQPGKHGETALHITASWGSQVMLERLLDLGGAENSLAPDTMGYTPFQLAISGDRGDYSGVECFLKRGINGWATRDKYGFSPLADAVLHRNWKIFEKLLGMEQDKERRAELMGTSWNGPNVLTLAARSGHGDILRELLLLPPELGLDINHQDSYRDISPLNAATYHGHVEIALELLREGAKMELVDIACRTPLHNSAAYRLPILFREMLSIGGYDLHERDALGLSVLDIASRNSAMWGSVPDTVKKTWKALDVSARSSYLHTTIVRIGTELSTAPQELDSRRYRCWRLQRIKLLGDAFNELATEYGQLDAVACYQEAFSLYNTANLYILNRGYERCIICQGEALRLPAAYSCRQCTDVILCHDCYTEAANHQPEGAWRLQQELYKVEALEARVRPLWALVVRDDNDFTASGSAFFAWAIHSHGMVDVKEYIKEYIKEKLNQYSALEDGPFRKTFPTRRSLPGRQFLELIQEEQDILVECHGAHRPAHNQLDVKWLRFRKNNGPDQEKPFSDCEGHEWLEVPIAELKKADALYPTGSWNTDAVLSEHWLQDRVSRSQALLISRPSFEADVNISEGEDTTSTKTPDVEIISGLDDRGIANQTMESKAGLSDSPVSMEPDQQPLASSSPPDHITANTSNYQIQDLDSRMEYLRRVNRGELLGNIMYLMDELASLKHPVNKNPPITKHSVVRRIFKARIATIESLHAQFDMEVKGQRERDDSEDAYTLTRSLIKRLAKEVYASDLAWKVFQIAVHGSAGVLGKQRSSLFDLHEKTLGIFLEAEGFMTIMRGMFPGVEWPIPHSVGDSSGESDEDSDQGDAESSEESDEENDGEVPVRRVASVKLMLTWKVRVVMRVTIRLTITIENQWSTGIEGP